MGQTLSVTFTPADTINYNTATAAVQINILKATPVVSWSTPADITYPASLGVTQLNATASVPGTFVYVPAAGSILSAGTQTLSVQFTPFDTTDYNTPAAKSVTIIVGKGTPMVTWSTPADITYPASLGLTQLNATASVPGLFVYTPAAGSTLNAGAQTLSVQFTPTSTANYNTPAAKTVQINVLKATPTVTWSTRRTLPTRHHWAALS